MTIAQGIALVFFALAYVIGLLVILFALSNIAHKAFEEQRLPTFISSMAAMVALFFIAFLFAKFLFGF